MSFTGPDDVSAIVADFGSSYCKVGFAGTDAPTAYFPTLVGNILSESVPSTYPSKRYGKSGRYIFDILPPKESVSLKSPLVDGLVEDWDLVEGIMDYVVKDRITSSASEETNLTGHPFLLADHLNASKADREKWCQLLFEKYNVAGVFMSKAGVLAVYGNARTTGLAVDMGGGAITLTPVQDGFPLMMGARVHPIGGRVLDQEIAKALQSRGIAISGRSRGGGMDVDGASLHPSVLEFQTNEVIREMKENVCALMESGSESLALTPNLSYELPDGNKIQIGAERYSIPALIFNPSSMSSAFPGVQSLQDLIVSSTMGCDPEARKDIVANIVLTGGTSAIKGMPERLLNDLLPIAPVGTRPKLACAAPEERRLGAWLGGSILGSLGTFHDLWFSAEEYKEHGAKMLHRKCP